MKKLLPIIWAISVSGIGCKATGGADGKVPVGSPRNTAVMKNSESRSVLLKKTYAVDYSFRDQLASLIGKDASEYSGVKILLQENGLRLDKGSVVALAGNELVVMAVREDHNRLDGILKKLGVRATK